MIFNNYDKCCRCVLQRHVCVLCNNSTITVFLLKKKVKLVREKKCIWTINYDSLNKNTISLKLHNRTKKNS